MAVVEELADQSTIKPRYTNWIVFFLKAGTVVFLSELIVRAITHKYFDDNLAAYIAILAIFIVFVAGAYWVGDLATNKLIDRLGLSEFNAEMVQSALLSAFITTIVFLVNHAVNRALARDPGDRPARIPAR